MLALNSIDSGIDILVEWFVPDRRGLSLSIRLLLILDEVTKFVCGGEDKLKSVHTKIRLVAVAGGEKLITKSVFTAVRLSNLSFRSRLKALIKFSFPVSSMLLAVHE